MVLAGFKWKLIKVDDIIKSERIGGGINIELTIIRVNEAREWPRHKKGMVATAIGDDGTGRIKVSLWNDDIFRVKAGHRIRITNGYVGSYRGRLEISAGRYGKIEILGTAGGSRARIRHAIGVET